MISLGRNFSEIKRINIMQIGTVAPREILSGVVSVSRLTSVWLYLFRVLKLYKFKRKEKINKIIIKFQLVSTKFQRILASS